MPKTSARLLSLLSLLQTRRHWPGAVLAERLAVAERTVRRDVDRLRELGYPISAVKGPDGGYRLDAGTQLPPLLFDDEQAVALAVALRTATVTGAGAGIEDGALRALTTLRQVLPARLRHRVDAVDVTAVPRPESGPATPVGADVLLALSTAVRAREVLRFDYAAPGRAGSVSEGGGHAAAGVREDDGRPPSRDRPPLAPRRAEPHHLVTWGGRWYLVAHDLDRDGWRVFRADQITPRIPTGPRFTPRALPGGDDVAAFVTGRFRGADGPGDPDWPCRGEVVLDLPADVVSRHTREGVVTELGPSRCRLALGSWSWTALAASFGRYDADIEVIGPPELRTAFADLARRYTAAAAEPGSPSG